MCWLVLYTITLLNSFRQCLNPQDLTLQVENLSITPIPAGDYWCGCGFESLTILGQASAYAYFTNNNTWVASWNVFGKDGNLYVMCIN